MNFLHFGALFPPYLTSQIHYTHQKVLSQLGLKEPQDMKLTVYKLKLSQANKDELVTLC